MTASSSDDLVAELGNTLGRLVDRGLRQLPAEAQLAVIADGGATIDAVTVDYDQCAVTARVVSERPHNNVAYERFTRHGPLALLPDVDGWAIHAMCGAGATDNWHARQPQ